MLLLEFRLGSLYRLSLFGFGRLDFVLGVGELLSADGPLQRVFNFEPFPVN